jgi:hypothetical protein
MSAELRPGIGAAIVLRARTPEGSDPTQSTVGVSVSGWRHRSALWRICDSVTPTVLGFALGIGAEIVLRARTPEGSDPTQSTVGVSVSGWRHRSALWRICDSVTPTVAPNESDRTQRIYALESLLRK